MIATVWSLMQRHPSNCSNNASHWHWLWKQQQFVCLEKNTHFIIPSSKKKKRAALFDRAKAATMGSPAKKSQAVAREVNFFLNKLSPLPPHIETIQNINWLVFGVTTTCASNFNSQLAWLPDSNDWLKLPDQSVVLSRRVLQNSHVSFAKVRKHRCKRHGVPSGIITILPRKTTQWFFDNPRKSRGTQDSNLSPQNLYILLWESNTVNGIKMFVTLTMNDNSSDEV